MIIRTLLTLVIFLIKLNSAIACTCSHFVGQQSASAVFVGKVIDIREEIGRTTVTFQVDSVLKGKSKSRIRLRTNSSVPACGMLFVKGKSYVIYGVRIGLGKMSVSGCSKSRRLKDDEINVVMQDDADFW